MTQLVDSLRAARDGYSADEYIRRVKNSIIDEMVKIDPSVAIEDTSYFNHSAIPDLIATWSKESESRPVYLRGSYAAIVAARDTEYINVGEPIILSLDPAQESDEGADDVLIAQRLTHDATNSTSTLITDAEAVGTVGGPVGETETPLGPLVRANFLRGGRGFIDPQRARLLVQTGSRDVNAREVLQTIVRENFLPDAALRLVRTAQVIDAALGREAETSSQEPSITGGRLSTIELRAILPWLMRQEGLTQDSRFWRRLGELFDLRLLEQVADSIEGVDLGRLLRANASKWTCRRSYAGLAVNDDDQIRPTNGLWRFRSGVLGVEFGNQRINVASDSRFLPGRDSFGNPPWEVVAIAANDFRLISATLRGISRSISVTAEESEDVRGDVDGLVNSIEDSFVISEMAVRVPSQSPGDASDVTLNFSRATATAVPETAISGMVRTAGRLLAFRSPVPEEDLERAVTP